ncbi:hypothetical protein CEX93_13220 [Xanthomonas euvesicatoria]|nr:hypothetical protein CEX93_13220 [Xanthomonas euvesicatoria]
MRCRTTRWRRTLGDSGIGNRESGIGNRESGIGNRESGIGNRESVRPDASCGQALGKISVVLPR